MVNVIFSITLKQTVNDFPAWKGGYIQLYPVHAVFTVAAGRGSPDGLPRSHYFYVHLTFLQWSMLKEPP